MKNKEAIKCYDPYCRFRDEEREVCSFNKIFITMNPKRGKREVEDEEIMLFLETEIIEDLEAEQKDHEEYYTLSERDKEILRMFHKAKEEYEKQERKEVDFWKDFYWKLFQEQYIYDEMNLF